MDDLKTFNADKFMKHVLNKKELAAEIMRIFFGDINSLMAELIKSAEINDFISLRKNAHRLKGSSLNVSAEKLSLLFLKLENIGKSDTVEGAHEVIKDIFAELENFKYHISNSNIFDNSKFIDYDSGV